MGSYSVFDNTKVVPSIHPQLADETVEGGGVDVSAFRGAAAAIHTGAWTDGTHTFSLEHSDTDEGEDYVAVPDDELQGTEPAVSDSGGQEQLYHLGYKGNKQFLRIVNTVTGSPVTGMLVAGFIVLGLPRNIPAN